MKKITLLFILITTISFSQIKQTDYNLFQAKEWSKDIALFRSKAFLFNDVLGASPEIRKFSVIPLAAAKSGELTTLIYKSEDLDKQGLILGFFGSYWNKSGVTFQGYGFKNLDKEKAIAFLNKIEKAMEDHKKFLKSDNDNNNIYFEFEDLKVLIYRDGNFILRVFWNGFDSTWENTAFQRSKRRFLEKL
ncbi:hypothetical protein V2595_15305 [Tenacibaculum maritimum]|uniref:hypothetical protein n=1 Tax=Tenacibaculum maritimum TaxID=107401 RepID=UPI0012E530A5|nr:hypothetical protein [Tenacibaculum maritimum]CAA0228062.1 conserved hypothetical protein [Tenacibaculum maritimum]